MSAHCRMSGSRPGLLTHTRRVPSTGSRTSAQSSRAISATLRRTSTHTAVVLSGKVQGSSPYPRQCNSLCVTGFTAIVDKQLSAKYDTLVNDAPELIKSLPWGKDFEVDVFRKPDFTALEILTFATGGIPAGINVSPGIVVIISDVHNCGFRSRTTTRSASRSGSRTSLWQ